MSLVYSMKAVGKVEGERDIQAMFEGKSPFKINSASGYFRVFLTKLAPHEDGFQYEGTVSDCRVAGFYNPAEENGTIVFMQGERIFSK
jgi:hypothetical protein